MAGLPMYRLPHAAHLNPQNPYMTTRQVLEEDVARLGRANASLAEDLQRARKRAERLSRRASTAAGCGYAAGTLPWRSGAACSPWATLGSGLDNPARGAAACAGDSHVAAEQEAGDAPLADPRVTSWGARVGKDTPAADNIAGLGGAGAESNPGRNPAAHARSARGGGGGTEEGRARDMTLGQLHELIEEVFASKARADQRHAPVNMLMCQACDSSRIHLQHPA